MDNIGKRVSAGIFWMVGARLVDRFIGIISTLILARLLVPGDFGLVAMATAIGGFLDLLGAFSFDMALIQNRKAERKHYDTVWTFNVIFGLTCGLLLLVLAEPAAGFYSEPRLTTVMYVLSISYFVTAFTNVGVVAFRKDLTFDKEFKFIFARRIATFIVTVTGAWLLRSYWALLAGMTVGRMISVIMSYTMNSYRPRLSLAAARELFGFSKWLLINNMLFFLQRNSCNFIIGRMFGASQLGIYTVSHEISILPSTELVAPINRVMFPGFSRMKGIEEVAQAFLKLTGLIALTVMPLGIGIAAVATPLVLTALGEKWIAAIPLIQLLAIHGALAATQGNNGVVWLALGHPRKTTSAAALFVAVLLPGLYLFMTTIGVDGAGYAYLVAHAVTVPYTMTVTRRLLGFGYGTVLAVLWRPALGVIVMYAAVYWADTLVLAHPPLLRLLFDSLAGAVTYIVVVLLAWRLAGMPAGSAERFVLERVMQRLRGLWRRPTPKT